MKRYSNLYNQIYSIENLKLADKRARKGKSNYKSIKQFDLNKNDNIINLHHILVNNEYKTSEYTIFKLNDGKERLIYRLPYYPDRLVHHAINNITEPIFTRTFTKNTYSCIKKRGIHKCLHDLKTSLKDVNNTKYCLKLDISKFYPSINNDILKKLLRRKFKDNNLLILFDEIIDSNQGLPIGNYLSQTLANFYLSYFDHWIKEKLRVKYYFRYCDDLVILGNNKNILREYLYQIIEYLKANLKLSLSNYQIFPINKRGIDFLGYKVYHTHILLRKSIKKRFIKMIKTNYNWKSTASYYGWLIHCNSINLRNKYIPHDKNIRFK